jgi:hypothetical protein
VAVLTSENVGVTDLLGAASLVVSEPALAELSARAGRRRAEEPGADGKAAGKAEEPVAEELKA